MNRVLSIVVVAYNGADDLAACLSSVGIDHRVVVIDNSSCADVQSVVSLHGGRYIDAGSNLGFAAGVNLGLSHIGPGDDVLLLNPDATIQAGSVERLHEALLEDPRTAAVTGNLVGLDGARQRARWPFPSPGRMWREALGIARVAPPRDAFLIGATLLIRREALADVGGFDERFFLYAEETDWQRRAVERGWTVRVVSDVTAQHRGAGTSDSANHREALFHAGGEIYIRKWFGASGWASYRAAALTGAALRAVFARGQARRRAKARFAIYLRGPRRVAGLPRPT